MTHHRTKDSRRSSVHSFLWGALPLLFFVAVSGRVVAEAPPAAISAFNLYVNALESRLAQQHRAQSGFLAPAASGAQAEMRLRRGELIVEKLTPAKGATMPGAMLHHWRGTAFAPGAKAADFERLMKNFNAYPQRFSPQVLRGKVISAHGDRVEAEMRVRQKHVITVVMDTDYDITFGRLDALHGYSLSRSTRIAEIDAAGTSRERALGSGEEHGFLWRLNSDRAGLGGWAFCGKRSAGIAGVYFAIDVQRAAEIAGAGKPRTCQSRCMVSHPFHQDAVKRMGHGAVWGGCEDECGISHRNQ
jgi:hypothetical protein